MKTVFITGANQGIGFEVARQMAIQGYRIFLGSRDASKGQQAVNQLQQAGANNITLLQIDVTNQDSIREARQLLEKEIGVLDILINNAAISGGKDQQIQLTSMDNLRAVFETNFFGAVQTTQAMLPLLSKADLPVIVNVSSELGSFHTHLNSDRENYLLYDSYSASKTSLNALTVLLAGQLKNTPFKINSVTPGHTATNLNNYMGTKTPEDAAKIIVKYATIEHEGPTGGFFGHEGAIDW